MSIHPQVIEKDGRKEFVVLPYEEFLHMQAEIEDYEDLKTLRDEKASAHSEPTRPSTPSSRTSETDRLG